MGPLSESQEDSSRALNQAWGSSEHGAVSDSMDRVPRELAVTAVLNMGPVPLKRQ